MWSTGLSYLCAGAVGSVFAIVGGTAAFLLHVNDFPHKRRFCASKKKLHGKTVVVTGSNTGIGYETAKDFASRGARVIMACRNVEKAEAARSRISVDTGNDKVVVMQCDLGDLESVRKFCKNFLAKESALHILVNNAGLGFGSGYTKQNFDLVVGTNHVGHFLLTYLLLDIIKKSESSRIVNVSSCRNYNCSKLGLSLKDSDGVKLPDMAGYPASKLLNVIHAKQLARKLKESNVLVYSVHPGYIHEGVFANQLSNFDILHYYMSLFRSKPFSISAKEGAQTTLHCALDDSIVKDSGAYFDNCREKIPNKMALDEELCEQIWNLTLDSVREYTQLAAD